MTRATQDSERGEPIDGPLPDAQSGSAPGSEIGPGPTWHRGGFVELENDWPREFVPGYRIVRVLGRGAQSVVYLAEHEATRRVVAVKMLEPYQVVTRSQRSRFEREAEIVATLKHPGLVTLFDRVDLPGGRFALVLEYVKGLQLGAWAAQRREASDAVGAVGDEFALIVARIADAVNHAHQNGVAHRDLKPSNILVDRDGQPRVLDFGVAKLLEGEGLTMTGDEPATLAYASPEQLDGGDVDQRTDVYSLGVVLFELLTRRRPFDTLRGRSAILRAMKERRAPSVREFEPKVAADLAAIVAKALDPDAQRRYQSMFLFATDLRRHLAGESVAAETESLSSLLRRLVTRHWRVVAATAAGAALLATGAARLGLLYQQTQTLYAEAMEQKARADNAVEGLASALRKSRIDLGRQLAASGAVGSGEELL
ncbi:MAG: serine/threonine-protein kinase, partial [Phycisphaerales bacterium]